MTVESSGLEESGDPDTHQVALELREGFEGNVLRKFRVQEEPAEAGGGKDQTLRPRAALVDSELPAKVLESYWDAISFNAESADRPGLRPPQLGALHAVLGYWTTNRMAPATVVMPTGTGKTETMLALLIAARPQRLLVLVPSDALREQIATKFEQLGVLQKLGIVSASALLPVVGRVTRGFQTVEAAHSFARACNVIVATPQVLGACAPRAQDSLVASCSHLFVDEAHHVAAESWSTIRDAFRDRHVVQFTATPFREDGRHLQGRIVYSFPLREAQAQGYFSKIDYTAVYDFLDVDQAIAEQSVARLRSDLDAGFDHVLMARVRSIDRAKHIQSYYEALAPELGPAIINSRMPKRQQRGHGDRSAGADCFPSDGASTRPPRLHSVVSQDHDPGADVGLVQRMKESTLNYQLVMATVSNCGGG